jgi:hypothetical protein
MKGDPKVIDYLNKAPAPRAHRSESILAALSPAGQLGLQSADVASGCGRSMLNRYSSSDWNRPADVPVADAHSFLQNAVNDYSGRDHQGYITSEQSILKDIDQELHDALDRLTDRPQLAPPEWPPLPTVLPTTTVPAGRFRGSSLSVS